MLGYSASLRVCLSGLALVKDISVTCFMRGGPLIGKAYYTTLLYMKGREGVVDVSYPMQYTHTHT